MERAGPNRSSTSGTAGSRDALGLRILGFEDNLPYVFEQDVPIKKSGKDIWELKYLFAPNKCQPDCDKLECTVRDSLTQKGTRTVTFPHLPNGNTQRKIAVKMPRWFSECSEVLPVLPLPGMSGTHRLTMPALDNVVTDLKEGRTPMQIASTIGTSESTISRVKRNYISKPTFGLNINPKMECFAIDDIKIGKSVYTLLLDQTHHTFIGLIRGTKKTAIGPTLEEIGLKCKNILRATMDFSTSYIPNVYDYFPGIVITGDKFHLFMRIQEMLTEARRLEANALTQAEIDAIWEWLKTFPEMATEEEREAVEEKGKKSSAAALLKKDRFLLSATFTKLSPREQGRVKGWLEYLPSLKAPHRLLQFAYWLFDQKGLSAAKSEAMFVEALEQFKTDSPRWYPTIEPFFRRTFVEIIAYFATHETNAFAESIIRQIRDMLRVSRGLTLEELVVRLNRKYGTNRRKTAAERKAADDATGEQTTPANDAPISSHRTSRHGIHRRKQYPLDITDPPAQSEFDWDAPPAPLEPPKRS